MSESREILFGSLLRSITNGSESNLVVERVGDVVYFAIGDHKFCTFGTHVFNEQHPLYGSSAIAAMAKRRDTPEERAETDLFNANYNRFMENRGKVLERVFKAALLILENGGEEAFLGMVDSFVTITENDDACQDIIRQIEQGK